MIDSILVLFVLLGKVRLCSLYCQCCDLRLFRIKLFVVDFLSIFYINFKCFTKKQQNDIGLIDKKLFLLLQTDSKRTLELL
jgi:hypothetical protein